MHRLLPFTLAISFLASAPGAARAAGDVRAHEFWFGGGGAKGFDRAIFNVPDDIRSTPDGVYTMGYMHNVDAHRAIGFCVYGTTETTPTVLLADTAGFYPTKFDLNTYNFGMRGRYTFTRETVVPSVSGGVNLAWGSVESKKTGELTYSGVSLYLGSQLGLPLGRRFMLSAELFGSFGFAKWKRKPFLNSGSDGFNPSIAGIAFDVSYLWGKGI